MGKAIGEELKMKRVRRAIQEESVSFKLQWCTLCILTNCRGVNSNWRSRCHCKR